MGDTGLFSAPLSFSQERLYFFDQLSPGSPLYSILYRLEFSGQIDNQALHTAFQRLITRHEVLRSRFIKKDDALLQEVMAETAFTLQQQSLEDSFHPAAAVDRIAREFASAPYDLATGPMIRACLLKLGESQHILLIGLHHIVFDGPSSVVMAQELGECYNAEREGRQPILNDLPIQYADFSQWQRQCQESGEFLDDLQFWQNYLAGAPTLLELTTDFPRPASLNYSGSTTVIPIPSEISAGLSLLMQETSTTPFVIYSTILSALLSLHSRQNDICLGFPVAGRDHPDLENLIGFFSNTLVLRSRITPEMTFDEAIHRTRDNVLDAIDHSNLPFDKLVEALAPERSLGWHPLFQVCVVYQTEEDLWALGPARAVFTPTDVNIAKFDLTFYFEERADDTLLRIEYSTELFKPARIEMLQRDFFQLCRAAFTEPQTPLGEIALISASTRQQMQCLASGAAHRLPQVGLSSLFEAQVQRTPDHIAVELEGDAITYGMLNLYANRLARHLQQCGAKTDDRIAILSSKNATMIIGILAILKADAAYVPLDPAYPSERLRFMVRDSGATIVLKDQNSPLMDNCPCPVLDVNAIIQDHRADHLPLPQRLEHPEQLAYIMYTSGSTGQPKGVAITQRAVARLVLGSDFLPFPEQLTFLQISNFSFDASTLEIWGALLHGGKLVLFQDPAMLAPQRLQQFLEQHAISSMFLTVALLNRLADSQPTIFNGVKHLMYGGDRASASTLQTLRQHGFGGQLINGYGPTETTTFACTHLTPDEDIASGDIPIGAPIANTCCYILSPSMQLLPIGVEGELFIGGAGLARCYHGQPSLTAERFVPNPFSEQPGERLYRTGDRCKWDENGHIRYLGRMDNQVKIDGFRIEPEEIRLALLQFPGVRQAAIEIQHLDDVQKRMIGYVVADVAVTESEIKAFLRTKMPRFMMPSQICPVQEILLNANGKIDFRALMREAGRLTNPAAVPNQRSALASQFLALCSDLLGNIAVNEEDRFFDIGGTSLLAMRLSARVEAELRRQLALSVIFQANTIGEMIITLESAPLRAIGRHAPQPREDLSWAPMSFSQERLFFLDQLKPGSVLYSIPYRMQLDGRLNAQALAQAFEALIQRHEVLRTCFRERDGVFQQHILPTIDFVLQQIDLSQHADATPALESLAKDFALTPFDLTTGPLIRAHLIKLSDQQHSLLLELHHIVFDGQSSLILAQDLNEFYTAYCEERPPQLATLAVQYADFSQWQRKLFAAGEFDQDIAYWKKTLADAPALLQLPTDKPRPAVASYSGKSLYQPLSAGQYQALLELAQNLAVTPFVIFSALVNVVLARYSGQDDICVGFPVAGRGHPVLEKLIGFFSNTVVLRCQIPPGASFVDIVNKTRTTLMEAMEHAQLPFDKIVEAVDPVRSLGWNPLFQACVVYQTAEDHWRLGTIRATHSSTDVDVSKFDCTFTLEQGANSMTMMTEYSDQLFSEETARRMLSTLIESIVHFAANPHREVKAANSEIISAPAAQSLRKRRPAT